jgi:Spy/CpxP family protein refolding chaperone
MKTRMFLKCAVVLASLLAATTFSALAQGQGGGGGRGAGGMGILTQEQRTKMREAIQDELTPLTEKLVAAQKEVVKAAMAENATEASVKAKLEAVQKIQTDLTVVRFKGFKAIASTLTAEQKTQLENARDGGYTSIFMMGGARGGGGGRRAGNNN